MQNIYGIIYILEEKVIYFFGGFIHMIIKKRNSELKDYLYNLIADEARKKACVEAIQTKCKESMGIDVDRDTAEDGLIDLYVKEVAPLQSLTLKLNDGCTDDYKYNIVVTYIANSLKTLHKTVKDTVYIDDNEKISYSSLIISDSAENVCINNLEEKTLDIDYITTLISIILELDKLKEQNYYSLWGTLYNLGTVDMLFKLTEKTNKLCKQNTRVVINTNTKQGVASDNIFNVSSKQAKNTNLLALSFDALDSDDKYNKLRYLCDKLQIECNTRNFYRVISEMLRLLSKNKEAVYSCYEKVSDLVC